MEEWKEYKISDVIDEISMGPFGSNIKVDNFIDFGVPVLNGSNLQGFKLQEESFNYVSQEKADSLGKANAHKGDVVITHRGTLGQIVYIPQDSKFEQYVISQSQFRLKLKQDLIRPDFFVYFFHTPIGQHRILMNASQVGVPALARPTTTFKDVFVPVPPLETQNAIMAILSSLDKKIEVNKRLNDNLEQQAQALFKSWYVDFEPFKDGEFVESEMGMIPKGWRVRELDEIIEISKQSINPNKSPEILFTHYSIPAYDREKQPDTQLGKEIFSNKFVVRDNMTLFSKLNPRIKRIWYVGDILENSICSTEFVPFLAKDSALSVFVFSLVSSQGFYDYILSMVNGATGSHQRFHPEETLSYKIAYNQEIALEYNAIAEPMITQILKNQQESRRLARLRDTLLPRLMSGGLEVNEIERTVG